MTATMFSFTKLNWMRFMEPGMFSSDSKLWFGIQNSLACECFRCSYNSSRMTAHYAVDIITFLPEFVQKARCEAMLAVVTMYHQLRDPTHHLTLGNPAAGKHISSKLAIDGNFDILTRARSREVFLSEFFWSQSNTIAYRFLNRY